MAENEIIIRTDDDFDLKKIFECGQCFRWNENDDGSYTGVAQNMAATIRQEGKNIFIFSSRPDSENIWREYFDLNRNYADIREKVCIDEYMRRASDFGNGIRILNQDRWETLCSFIISQCNNIPRIKKIVETMCRLFGEEIDFNGKIYYAFPSAEKIAVLTSEDLASLRAGYRAPYIIAAAKAVASGELDLDVLAESDVAEAKKRLMELPGIGEKVANCVILFSLRMPRAFPVDVWMKKAIAQHYPNGLDPKAFGENAGIAQQYMFFYQRSGVEEYSA